MGQFSKLLESRNLLEPLLLETAQKIASEIGSATEFFIYPTSLVASDQTIYFLGLKGINKYIGLVYSAGAESVPARDFGGEQKNVELDGKETVMKIGPADHANCQALRKHLPFTAPKLVGVKKSAGLGDRLGIAGPGHIRASRGTGVVPFLAQQSIRELQRTQREAVEVLDAATIAVLQEGYRDGFGSDADHLKTPEDIDYTAAAAGFTMFTIDPSAHVDPSADTDFLNTLKNKYPALPFAELQSNAKDYEGFYVGRKYEIAHDFLIAMTEEEFLRAACKYARAIAQTVLLDRHLQKVRGRGKYELEMSVDETPTPTTVNEHFYFANELRRLGVSWVSLAPRFIGEFEKGVDYKGDLKRFEEAFQKHVAIAKYFGGYKISLHSGSDKFSIYPIAAKLAGNLVHLKTAGTSYLEALRVIGKVKPDLFRRILRFCLPLYEEEKKSYHVSADVRKVPTDDTLRDDQLSAILDLFDGRQLLHVTFGKVLTTKKEDGSFLFRDELLHTLKENEETHYAAIEKHIARHLAPFKG